MIKTALFAAAAAIATIATAAPVFAKDVAVSYHDLDLSTPEGQSKLARRLDAAARDACDVGAIRTGTRIPAQSSSQCYKEAQARSKDTMAAILNETRKGG
jgi:UrcA family protein